MKKVRSTSSPAAVPAVHPIHSHRADQRIVILEALALLQIPQPRDMNEIRWFRPTARVIAPVHRPAPPRVRDVANSFGTDALRFQVDLLNPSSVPLFFRLFLRLLNHHYLPFSSSLTHFCAWGNFSRWGAPSPSSPHGRWPL